MRQLITIIAVSMSLYHMYVAGFGPPEAVIFRGTHLMFALVLVFLLYPTLSGTSVKWRTYDMLLLALGLGGVLNIFFDYEAFIDRIIYIDDLTTRDIFFGVATDSSRARRNPASHWLGLTHHSDRICVLRSDLYEGDPSRSARAVVSLDRGNFWLHTRCISSLRHALCDFWRFHGKKRHRPAYLWTSPWRSREKVLAAQAK